MLSQVTTMPADETVLEVVQRIGLRRTFLETDWIDWAVLLGCIFAGIVAGRVAQFVLRKLGGRVESRGWKTRSIAFASAAGPAYLLLITIGLKMGLMPIVMSAPVRAFVSRVLVFLYIVALAWFLYNLVDVVEALLRRVTKRTHSTLDDQVVPLVRKTLRLFLLVVFALFTAENIFGADITAWLAGLGIAGLAVSLAAQDSIKNLFGSLTIFLDRPFAVGDAIEFGGHEGPVEQIGFRSTKLRTLDGDLVTIPNSKIVDGSVRNIGRRLSFRRVIDLTIPTDTPPDKVEQAIAIVKEILAEPEIASAFDLDKTPPRVAFDAITADALRIKVFYWFTPPRYWEFLDHAQRVNLALLRRFEAAGIELAFPTRTLYLADDPKRGLSVRLPAGADEAPDAGNGFRERRT